MGSTRHGRLYVMLSKVRLGGVGEFKEFREFREFKELSLTSLISLISLTSLSHPLTPINTINTTPTPCYCVTMLLCYYVTTSVPLRERAGHRHIATASEYIAITTPLYTTI